MTDGARNALLGYLYQFAVVASLRASATGHCEPGAGWPTLVGSVRRGRLLSEVFGQDAAVVPAAADEDCVAVQVKHSAESDSPIGSQAFVELLHGFDQSARAAARARHQVTKFYVVTNRRRIKGVAGVWDGRSEKDLRNLIAGSEANGRPEWLNKLVGAYDDVAAATAAWVQVLRNLEPPVEVASDRGCERLCEFARRHGVLDSEMRGRVDTLLGRLLRETADSGTVEVTAAWLRESLVGAADARELTFGASGGVADAGAEQVRARLGLEAWSADAVLTRRRFADDLRNKVARFAVTFVCGVGGVGKTVLSMQHLLAPGGAGPLALSLTAAEATEAFLADSLRRLRSPGSTHALPNDSFDDSVARLRTANTACDQLVAVNVDALDEVGLTRGELRRLMTRFLPPASVDPGVRLVVSGRPLTVSANERHALLREWFGLGHPAGRVDQFGFVDVLDFNADELREAARHLGGSPEDRLVETFDAEEFTRSEGLADFLDDLLPSRAVHRPTLASLKHPVVWGAYAALQPPARDLVLDGSPAGTDQLAGVVVERFLTKCAVRRNHLFHGTHLEQSLRQAAAASARLAPPHSRADVWDAACRPTLGVDGSAVLHGEALTYGLITGDQGGTWRWRHEFITDWLTRSGA